MSALTLDKIVGAIRSHRFSYANEDELQEGLATVIANAGLEPVREVRLNGRDRIDILVERVGIEVKVAGGVTHPWDQLKRYAECEEIDALVLVTSRWYTLPDEVGGKPLATVSLAGAGL